MQNKTRLITINKSKNKCRAVFKCENDFKNQQRCNLEEVILPLCSPSVIKWSFRDHSLISGMSAVMISFYFLFFTGLGTGKMSLLWFLKKTSVSSETTASLSIWMCPSCECSSGRKFLTLFSSASICHSFLRLCRICRRSPRHLQK